MGLPTSGIVPAFNINSVLGELLDGVYDGTSSAPVPTYSPAMDMAYPSGWPRLEAIYGGSLEAARADILRSNPVTDAEIAATVNALREKGYTIDTHGAVAYVGAARLGADVPKVIFATGHPAKQLDIMTHITGAAIELPVQLTRFMSVKRNPMKIAPTLPALRKLMNNYN